MTKVRVVTSTEVEVVPITPEERVLLIEAGFVRITGFYMQTERGASGESDTSIVGQRLRQEELGTWGEQRGRVAVVTRDGQVWLAAKLPTNEAKINEVIARLKLRQGAYVPYSRRGEGGLCAGPVLRRLADPDCDPYKTVAGD